MLARQADALGERLRLVRGATTPPSRPSLTEVDAYETRMRDDVSRYQSQITNILWQLDRRGQRFFDELVRAVQHHAPARQGRRREPVPQRGRRRRAEQRIEEEVQALIDWLVRQNLAMWEKADGLLRQRREALRDAAGAHALRQPAVRLQPRGNLHPASRSRCGGVSPSSTPSARGGRGSWRR